MNDKDIAKAIVVEVTGPQLTDLQRIDQLISDMRARQEDKRDEWSPTETHPVLRKWEIREHNQKLDSVARQVKLTGGQVKDYGYRD